MLIVAMDANFRLKSRLRGSINREPTLGLGWSYFVNNGPYTDFIKDYVDEDEVRANEFIEIELLTVGIDPYLRWFSSPPQHAHQEVKRSSCDWYGCCQLRSPSTFPTVGYGRLTEGRTVRAVFTFELSLINEGL
jgi:hypothetical protein